MRWTRCLVAVGVAMSCLTIVPEAAAQPSPGALPPVLTLRLDLTTIPDVPGDALGVAVNVTVTNPVSAGYLTVYPCSAGRPATSNLNFVAGQTVPNLVVTALDEFSAFCVETIATADVIVDLVGYVPFGSPLTMLPAPVRFADTRQPGNRAGVRLRAGEIRSVLVAGTPGVPADAAAVVFNATAVDPDRSGFLTVFPCGRPMPSTSTLNFTRGVVVPNLVTTAVGAGGAVCFSAIADVDLVADVSAYVPGGSTGMTLLAAPERLFDTRTGVGGPPAVLGFEPRPVQVTGRAAVPFGATGAILNLTATEGSGTGYVAAFPCGGEPPLVSSLNFGAGQNVANAAIVKLAPDGSFCLRSNSPVHAIVDIAGYLTSTAAFVPLVPERIGDTREDAQPLCNLGIVETEGRWQWIDLATGALGAVFDRPAIPFNTTYVSISSDCATAVLVANRVQYTIDRAGRNLSAVPIPRGRSLPLLFTSDVGLMAMSFSRSATAPISLVDLTTDQVLLEFDALDSDLGWDFAGAARDQSLFMFFTRLSDSTKEFHVLDFNGFEVATFRLPAGADFFSVSPTGLYMSYGLRVMTVNGERIPEMHVVTSAGDPVEVRPTTIGDRSHAVSVAWLSDGRGIGCSSLLPLYSNPVTTMYDMFAPPRLTGLPCVRAAL